MDPESSLAIREESDVVIAEAMPFGESSRQGGFSRSARAEKDVGAASMDQGGAVKDDSSALADPGAEEELSYK